MTRPKLTWRSVVDPSDPLRYAHWVRDLGGRSGAYIIRDKETDEILYVGESHKKRLRSTLTRHFQSWNGYQAGTIYNRYRVEVALHKLDASSRDVMDAQAELIGALAPRDNVHHQRRVDLPEVEFDPADFQDEW